MKTDIRPTTPRRFAFALCLAFAWAGCGSDTPQDPGAEDPDVVEEVSDDTGADQADPGQADRGAETDRGGADRGEDDAGDGSDVVLRPDIPIEDSNGTPDVPQEEGMRIIAVSPERGPSSGGTEILVIGLGFTVDTDVYIGGVLCDSIDFVDETKLICFTPENPPGVYDVKALNEEEEASRAGGFTYVAPVGIDRIEPGRGPVSGGMPATLYGEGFTDVTQVSIGGRLALGIQVIDDDEIRLVTPAGQEGLATLQVSNENGLTHLQDGFEYYEPVRIDALLPAVAHEDGGAKVRIEGAGFGDGTGLTVMFGLLETTDLELTDGGDLIATVPPGPADTYVDVTIVSPDSGEITAGDAFYYYADGTDGPLLIDVQPDRGSTDGGELVVLSGVDMTDVDEVSFDGANAPIREQKANYLVVEAPAHTAGAVAVALHEGEDSYSVADAYTYIEAVSVAGILPNTGDVSGGDEFTIRGAGFRAGTTVRFGALLASDVDVEDERITGVTPPGVVGPTDVVVTSPDGLHATLFSGFTYTQALEVHGITPTKGSIAGGTLVYVRGAGFTDVVTLSFGEEPGVDVQVLDSATIVALTPVHAEGYVEVSVAAGAGDPASGPERFLYFDPTSITGGTWGDPIVGNVNVTVLSSGGAPLPDAVVTLSVRGDGVHTATTNVNGQATISGSDLSGPQTVSATRLGFSSATVQAVDAENITVVLSCVPENMCGSNADCREGFVCTCGPPFGPIGICLVDQFCGIEIESQEQYDEMCVPDFQGGPFGLITGNLTGVHKVADPRPGERIMGMVVTTDPHPFQATPISSGSGNVLENDGEYTLRSRLGEIALVAVCGIQNDNTETFTAKYIGVRRGLFIVEAETYEIDIECDIKLDVPLTIKSVNPPLAPGGPNILTHQPYLHFGSEGYFGGLPPIEGTDDTITGCCYAPLEGQLAGLDYYIRGGAFTDGDRPWSQSVVEGVGSTDGTIVLPEFVPVPDLVVPSEGGTLLERYFEWSLETDSLPDFYYLQIFDRNETIFWDVYVPGEQTVVNLPFWPEDAEIGLFPPGQLFLQVLAVKAFSFDFDQFDLNDFSLTNWESFSVNNYIFNNPAE